MIESRVILTALPAGATRGGRRARLSVFLSPRLRTDQGDRLGLFDDFVDWPAVVDPAQLIFEVQVDGGPAIRARAAGEEPSSELWRAVFARSTYVEPYRFPEELARKPLSTYPAGDVLGYLRDRYTQTILSSPTRLPHVESVEGRLEDLVNLRDRLARAGDGSVSRALGALLDRARVAAREVRLPVVAGTGEAGPAGLSDEQRGFLQLLLFHHRDPDGKPAGLPKLDKSAKARRHLLEFHAGVAALSDHPQVLRRLGLVLDLTFDATRLPDTDETGGRLRLVPVWSGTAPKSEVITPWTQYVFRDVGGARVFCAASRNPGADLVDGLANLQPAAWNLEEVDVDGATFQLFGMVTALRLASGARPIDDPARAGLPALRSGGLALWRAGNALDLSGSFADALDLNQAVEGGGDVVAHAEDLTRGYRADVQGGPGRRWRSLHEREGRYSVKGGPAIPPMADEGYLQRSVVQKPGTEQDPNQEIRAHDSLFAWTGWSLSVPRPGRALSRSPRAPDASDPESMPQDVPNDPLPDGIPLRTSYEVTPGSLPRLRFGEGYRVRLRAVDLAGNSLTIAEADDLLKRVGAAGEPVPVLPAPGEDARRYLRFEPLSAPELVARAEVTEGESLERLVIRSDHDRSAKKWVTDNAGYGDTCERHVIPPKVSQLMAERHGMFDGSIGTGQDLDVSYAIADKERGKLSDRKVLDARTGTIVNQGAQVVGADPGSNGASATEGAGVYVICADEQFIVPYLPDPLVRGATMGGLPGVERGTLVRIATDGTVDSEPGPDPFDGEAEAVLTASFGPPGAWPMLESFRLQIAEGDGPPKWNDSRRILTVALPKATRAKVQLSTHTDLAGLALLGIWRWIEEGVIGGIAPKPLSWYQVMAAIGRLWPISPARELILVHAVQRPLVEPKILELEAVRPEPGSTHTYLRGEIRVDGKSTEKLDLVAAWAEDHDTAPGAPGAWQPGDPNPETTKLVAGAHVFESQIHLEADRLATEDSPPYDPAAEVVPAAVYDEASDRMLLRAPVPDDLSGRTYLSRHELGDTRHRRIRYRCVGTSRFREYFDPGWAKDPESFTRQGPEVVVSVPSSARPAPPHVLYVVPAFRWEREQPAGTHVFTSRRWGNVLRVYLDRPWYSSGEGELLGVVLWPDWTCQVPERLSHSVTAWAKDPLWRTNPTYATPDAAHFPLAVDVGTGLRLERVREGGGGAPAAEDPLAVEPYPVTVAGHEPHFDAERGLWYCDVEIHAGPSYTPFVRLALCRYQRRSIASLELSQVVVCDYAQLHPKRTVTVIREPDDPDLVNLAVRGRTYEGAKGPDDFDPHHDWRGSEVEVTIERRTGEELDDELAWEPADDPTIEILPDGGFDPSAELAPGEERAFEPKLRWSGRVRLPAERAAGEFRIVVREFERYARVAPAGEPALVPYRLGRRLVFAETIDAR
jgi:hypothetical protein